MAELDDELGEIGLVGMNACGFQRGVELDLFRGHRLDLDDFVGAAGGLDAGRRRCCAGFFGVAAQCTTPPARCSSLQTAEVDVEMLHGVLADLLAGFAQRLPVGHLVDDAGALGLDDVGGVADVLAQLRVLHAACAAMGKAGAVRGSSGRCALTRSHLSFAGEDLREVHGSDAGALAMQRALDVHEAAVVAGGADFGVRC